MFKKELQAWLSRWALKPLDGAKVLGIDESKMATYLSGAHDIPDDIEAHVDTFDNLADAIGTKIIKERVIK